MMETVVPTIEQGGVDTVYVMVRSNSVFLKISLTLVIRSQT